MKIALLFTGSGPLVIATSHDSLMDPVFLDKLHAKGIEKTSTRFMPRAFAGRITCAARSWRKPNQSPMPRWRRPGSNGRLRSG
jgi:hypothetical protein